MVLFDIETNIFPIEIIEFGAIIVDKFVSRKNTTAQADTGSHRPAQSGSEDSRAMLTCDCR